MSDLLWIDRRRRLVRGTLLAFAGLAVAVGLYVLAVVPPTQSSIYPGCQLYQLTGLHCPGCGTTRALHALLNADPEQALAYNPFAFVALPLLAWFLVQSFWFWFWDRPLPPRTRTFWTRYGPLVIGGLLLAYAILRNVPIYPFTLLAPHELAR